MSEKPPASHEKVSRWDRPKPPRDWRWVVGGIGRTLITLGLLMFAFVAYQLWGTGIQTARAQRTLAAEFDELVAATPPPTIAATTTSAPPSTAPTPGDTTVPVDPTPTTAAPVLSPAKPIPDQGKAVARLEIPRMGLNRIVVEGATAGDLVKGPGHFPETPLPGQLGNAAIAGHRTTYLHPFFDIDKLQPGDEIIVTTLNGRYVYHVTGTEIVAPEDYAAVIPTTDVTKATLTLVSCTPRYSAKNRIIVRSELAPDLSDALTEAAPLAPSLDPPGDTPVDSAVTLPDEGPVSVVDTAGPTATTAPVDSTSAGTVPVAVDPPGGSSQAEAGAVSSPDAFTDGWFSDSTAIPQAIMWGIALAAIAVGSYLLCRRFRRYWVGIAAGFAPFIVVLYFFYENVNRLLPPNL